jgi:hypothetical protein
MRVVIRFGKGPKVGAQRRSRSPVLAMAMGALLTLGAITAGILGLWRIAADLKWASDFAISTGLFSHWQVWIAGSAALEVCSRFLHRYARQHSIVEEVEEPEKVRSHAV